MAKMHSRKKGKSGSHKPLKPAKPTWLRYKPKEIEMLVVKLAKEGKTGSQIGLVLRDTYGVPDVKSITEKSISEILAEKKLAPELPDDLVALMKKSIAIRKHLEENRKDEAAHRGLLLTESKIRRLIKYYKRIGRLVVDWKYQPEKLKMYTE
ncbi:MAG: 30S ribosomal protein S15 [Candidatus Woesearchaeota archaeon]